MKMRLFGWSGVVLVSALGSLFQAGAAPAADYSGFRGNYVGHESFHYPGLGLKGHGHARLKISASQGAAVMNFNRSLHVAGMAFPFSERTRFSAQGKFRSVIAVPNFASFEAATGRAHVAGNRIRFKASYPMLGTAVSLVQVATLTVQDRKLTYRVVVDFSSPAGLQKVAVFTFTGRRAK